MGRYKIKNKDMRGNTYFWILITIAIGLLIANCFKLAALEAAKKSPKEPPKECQYGGYPPECYTKEEYCRLESRAMFEDLSDTWGVNTNNQDSISRAMIEMYDRCLNETKE